MLMRKLTEQSLRMMVLQSILLLSICRQNCICFSLRWTWSITNFWWQNSHSLSLSLLYHLSLDLEMSLCKDHSNKLNYSHFTLFCKFITFLLNFGSHWLYVKIATIWFLMWRTHFRVNRIRSAKIGWFSNRSNQMTCPILCQKMKNECNLIW